MELQKSNILTHFYLRLLHKSCSLFCCLMWESDMPKSAFPLVRLGSGVQLGGSHSWADIPRAVCRARQAGNQSGPGKFSLHCSWTERQLEKHLCVCVCTHIWVHVYTHAYPHAHGQYGYMYMYIHACMCTVYRHINTWIHTHEHTYIYIYIYITFG